MTKIRPLPGSQVIVILESLGFKRTTVVPFHKGEDIGRGLLQEIIKDTKLTKEEFLKYLV